MIGIDEVGRGALAGPLVVAGCFFTENPGFTYGLNDSKLLTRKKREELDSLVKSNTMFKIVIISSEDVDRDGLTKSIKRAIIEILKSMPSDMEIMMDGKYNFLKNTKYFKRSKVEIKADQKHTSVMAASIIAKVERDRIMREYSLKYPEYGFENNVGYGTKKHLDSISIFGPTKIHRKTFKPMSKNIV
jgi:ribonuclease HII